MDPLIVLVLPGTQSFRIQSQCGRYVAGIIACGPASPQRGQGPTAQRCLHLPCRPLRAIPAQAFASGCVIRFCGPLDGPQAIEMSLVGSIRRFSRGGLCASSVCPLGVRRLVRGRSFFLPPGDRRRSVLSPPG